MMHVQINDGDAFEAARLQIADGDRHIVERTETFAVIREGVMKAAADMAAAGRTKILHYTCLSNF